MESSVHKNETRKQAEIAMHVSNRADFKSKSEETIPLCVGKGTVHQVHITRVNVYMSDISIPNFIKQASLDTQGRTHALTSR